MTIEEIQKGKPEGSTHYYFDDDGDLVYMGKDTIGRWCYVENDWEGWPCRSSDVEYIESQIKPL